MITLIAGIILLTIPFVLVFLFSDKKIGFVYVLFFLLLFQTLLAVLTQSLGAFYYWVATGGTLLADAVVLLVYFKIRKRSGGSLNFSLNSVDWVLVAVAVISILCLYQVHYNYTGKINLSTDQSVSYHEVKNMVYQYPYFSDEWYAVSLSQGAIDNHSLPVRNTLNGSFFMNLELFFHSLIAQMALILGLDLLSQYTILSIFFNALIIILVCLFLRANRVSGLAAGVCSLSALYITCGANLPGLWHLIPLNLGLLFFLTSIYFMETKNTKVAFLSTILASLFYPPFVPFYWVGLGVFLLPACSVGRRDIRKPQKLLYKIIFGLFLLSSLSALTAYILATFFQLASKINYFLSRIFFVSFSAPYMPQFNFYNIVPIPAVLLAVFGLYYAYKNKKWFLSSVFILGAVFWASYSFTTSRFFVEYERIVVLTSIVIVIISGLGLKQLEDYISIKLRINATKILKIMEAAVLLIFLISAPLYTTGENWKKTIYIEPSSGVVSYPKSPANNYITVDDLKIFKGIENKKFLSVPWKGTTIGIATKNIPVLTKQGTISIGQSSMVDDFLEADCQGKKDMAKKLDLDYIYIYKFDCSGFKELAESSEGFYLYEVE